MRINDLRAIAFVVCLVSVPTVAIADEKPALVIAEGSIARQQLVALGRDLQVSGEALAGAASINGSTHVSGSVGGDLIVLGGDVTLTGDARVDGDVFVLGGAIYAGPGSVIAGRSVSYPSIHSAWLVLLEGPALGLSSFSGPVVAAKLALVAAWLAWVLILFVVSGTEVLVTSGGAASEPFRNFLVGLGAVFSLFLTALFLSAFAATVIGLPLLFLVIFIAVLLKLWGMVGVFHACGAWVARLLGKRRWVAFNHAVLGVVVLGLLKLAPWIGTWLWTAASLIGVGAALTTRFGRRGRSRLLHENSLQVLLGAS
ncbi:MAG: hypothetical protein OES47_08940 [Acidobacteriota bacterium]|nr:hypothetical protein [Acidobacteriota bacterium]